MTFPTTLDSFPRPDDSDPLDDPDHTEVHNDVATAVEAVEAKLGTGSSTATSGKVLTGTGAGASSWEDPAAPSGSAGGQLGGTYPNPTVNASHSGSTHAATQAAAEATAAAALASHESTDHATFAPDDIADLALWLDASDATTVNAGSPVNNDPVSAWADKSAANNDTAQATANNRPVYKTNIQNGKAVIRFDPSSFNQYLSLSGTGLNLFRDIDGATMFAALSVPSFSSTGSFLYASKASGAYGRLEFAGGSTIDPTEGGSGSTLSLVAASTFSVVCSFIRCLDGFLNTECTLLDTSGAPGFATAGNFVNTASSVVEVGSTSAGHELTGDIGELIVYQRALTAYERRQVMEYLSTKWATL